MCNPSKPIQRTPAEHAARIAAIADLQAQILNLPASATRHDIHRVLRRAFSAAVGDDATARVKARLFPPTRWQRLKAWFRR